MIICQNVHKWYNKIIIQIKLGVNISMKYEYSKLKNNEIALSKLNGNEDFGTILRTERKRRKLTLRDLANELGISYSTLGKYERNENEPDLGNLKKISAYFDLSIDYLLGMSYVKKSNRSVLLPHHERMLEAIYKFDDYSPEQEICYKLLAEVNILLEQHIYLGDSFEDNIIAAYTEIIALLSRMNAHIYDIQKKDSASIQRVFLDYKFSIEKSLIELLECYKHKFLNTQK